MSDMNRDQLAFHFFKLMNQDRYSLAVRAWIGSDESLWESYKANDWHLGYLRLADEVIKKGYKP